MKKYLNLLGIGIISFALSAQKSVSKVNAEPKKVVVYASGAILYASHKIDLIKGQNTVIFEKIPSMSLTNSIHAFAEGTVSILSVNLNNEDENVFYSKANIKLKTDSIKRLKRNLNDLGPKLTAVIMEIHLYETNKSIGGSNNGVSVAELLKMGEIYRTRLAELYILKNNYENQKSEYNQRIEEIENEIEAEKLKFSENNLFAEVVVDASAAGNYLIGLQYYHPNAGWKAKYNVRYESVSKPLSLDYNCRILNNTGYDWKNCEIVLSTAEPLKSADFPSIVTWKIPYNVYKSNNEQRMTFYNNASGVDVYGKKEKANWKNTVNAPSASNTTEIFVGELSLEIAFPSGVAVKNMGTGQDFYLQTFEIPVSYQYQSIPRLEKDAYLLAKLTGWNKYNLINGPADVYSKGNFIGTTAINTVQTDDTLDLSLGLDHKVMVTKKLSNEKISDVLLSSKKREHYEYDIVVKNTHTTAIELELMDQIPVSTDEKIEVSLEEKSGANLNVEEGLLTWKFKLAPGESKTFKVVWEVKYPQGTKVQVKQFRSLKCPEF